MMAVGALSALGVAAAELMLPNGHLDTVLVSPLACDANDFRDEDRPASVLSISAGATGVSVNLGDKSAVAKGCWGTRGQTVRTSRC
jgi:hypothetical protein